MNFQEFLARKRALALVEHMNTLSEADAQQLFDTLDEETVEFMEMVLNEAGLDRADRVKSSFEKKLKRNPMLARDVNFAKKLDAARAAHDKALKSHLTRTVGIVKPNGDQTNAAKTGRGTDVQPLRIGQLTPQSLEDVGQFRSIRGLGPAAVTAINSTEPGYRRIERIRQMGINRRHNIARQASKGEEGVFEV